MQKQTEEVELLELLNTEFKIFVFKIYNDLDYKIQNFKDNWIYLKKTRNSKLHNKYFQNQIEIWTINHKRWENL